MHMQLLRPEEKEDTPTLPCCLYFNVGHKVNAMNELPIEYLHECLDYNPDTGYLTWKKRPVNHFATRPHSLAWNKKNSGNRAGCRWVNPNSKKAYILMAIDNRKYRAHRVAYAIHHGAWPNNQIDHNDGDGTNNRALNLKEATDQQNSRNQRLRSTNSSGVTGVRWDADRGKWNSSITVDGKTISLGRHKSKDAAIIERKNAERRYEFNVNHGQDRPL